ncbi:MAG: hypothetical protein IME99_03970 [Proteobacteria bacterium]|nr:hypothetical protein [Pseudomonadota bacterium]
MLHIKKIARQAHLLLIAITLLSVMLGCGVEIDSDGGTVNGSATLVWTPPTTRMNNNSLPDSEIASYVVYYGTTSTGPYTDSVAVAKSACTPICQTEIGDLTSGTYYFVVETVDAADTNYNSGYTLEVSKVI